MTISVSKELQRLIVKEPLLWSYQPQPINRILQPYEQLGAHISLRSKYRLIYQSKNFANEQQLQDHRIKGSNQETFGYLKLHLNSDAHTFLYFPWSIAIPLALLISWFLLTIPLTNAHKLDQVNHKLMLELVDLNTHLEKRVEERTLDLEKTNERLLTIQEEERAY